MRTAIAFITMVLTLWPTAATADDIATHGGVTIAPGEGVTALTADRLPTCLQGPLKPDRVPIPSEQLDVSIVRSAEQVLRQAHAKAAAQFGVGIGAKVSLGFEGSTSETFSRDSEVLVVSEAVACEASVLRGPYKVDQSWSSKTDAEFSKTCGTQFVSEVDYGGSFIAVLRAEHSTIQEAQQMEADLRIAISAGSGSAEVDAATKRLESHSSFHVHVSRLGVSDDFSELSIPDLVRDARSFPTHVCPKDKDGRLIRHGDDPIGVPFLIRTNSYSVASRSIAPDLSLATRETVLYQLAGNYDIAVARLKQVTDVLSNQDRYFWTDRGAERNQLINETVGLSHFIDAISYSAKSCLTGSECTFDMLKTPVPSVWLPPELNGQGGCTQWDDANTCLHYSYGGTGAQRMEFSGKLPPHSKIKVHLDGRPAIPPPPLGGDRDTEKKVRMLVVVNGNVCAGPLEKRTYFPDPDPGFEMECSDVDVPSGTFSGYAGWDACHWHDDRACSLSNVRVEITPTLPTK